jgi:hypothetical protein
MFSNLGAADIDYGLMAMGAGASVLLGIYLFKRYGKKKTTDLSLLKSDPVFDKGKLNTPKRSIQESIRQIGLIERSEFDSFYEPIISRVEFYEQAIGAKQVGEEYFKVIFKALRKRRAVIFEFGQAEQDKSNGAFWTYSLFLALSVRYVARVLDDYDATLHGHKVNANVLSDNLDMAAARFQLKNSSDSRPSKLDPTRVHLIPGFTNIGMISKLSDAGIYPFILGSVSGSYSDRFNPFYQVIEDVEAFVRNEPKQDDTENFRKTIDICLSLIASNMFTKNEITSLVFDGISYLCLDTSFFWELYRGHVVYQEKCLSRPEFLERLHGEYNLRLDREKQYYYSINFAGLDAFGEDQTFTVELVNMIALPYSEFPAYGVPEYKRRITRHVLERTMTIAQDATNDDSDLPHETNGESDEEDSPTNSDQIKKKNPPKRKKKPKSDIEKSGVKQSELWS